MRREERGKGETVTQQWCILSELLFVRVFQHVQRCLRHRKARTQNNLPCHHRAHSKHTETLLLTLTLLKPSPLREKTSSTRGLKPKFNYFLQVQLTHFTLVAQ